MDSPEIPTTDVETVLGCSPDTARRPLETLFGHQYAVRRNAEQQPIWWAIERKHTEREGAATDLEPVNGPTTNTVNGPFYHGDLEGKP